MPADSGRPGRGKRVGLRALAVVLLAVASSTASGLRGQTTPAPVDPALRARFGFVGPKVHKIGRGLAMLEVADLDGERGLEILVYDDKRARIEIVSMPAPGTWSIRDSGAVVAELGVERLPLPERIAGMGVGDVDGDGTPDLFTLSVRGRLEVRPRGAGDAPVIRIDVGASSMRNSLRVADVDGDQRADAVVLTGSGLRIVTDLATEPQVSRARPIGGQRPQGVLTGDFDGNGAIDIAVASDSPSRPVRVYRNRGQGQFADALLVGRAGYRYLARASMDDGRDRLLAVQRPPGRVVELALNEQVTASGLTPTLSSVPARSQAGPWPFAHGDVDGDGDPDLVLAHPERAELIWLLEHEGHFRMQRQACPSGISSLALGDLDRDGTVDLLLASPDEELVGWLPGAVRHRGYPIRLPSVGAPCTVAVVGSELREPDGPAAAGYLFLTRDRSRKARLMRAALDGETAGADAKFSPPSELLVMGRLSDPPARLLLAELDSAAGYEVVFATARSGMSVLLRDADGKFVPPGKPSEFAKEVGDGALALLPGSDPGEPTRLLVTRPRFVRALRYNAAGEPVVSLQDNGPSTGAKLALAVRRADGWMYFDRTDGQLHQRGDDGVETSADVTGFAATHLIDHADDTVLMLTDSGVLRIRTGRSLQLTAVADLEPPTDDTQFRQSVTGDFDHDGKPDVAVIDGALPGIQIAVHRDGLERALAIPVFQNPDGPSGDEPSRLAAGDIDGDGRDDLVVVCHDRLLIYLQQVD